MPQRVKNACSRRCSRTGVFFHLALLLTPAACATEPPLRPAPVPLIFDTDIGNDIDDALALALLHALADRNECQLLAVAITKDHPAAARVVALVNRFYGRPSIPIGVVREGKTRDAGQYLEPTLASLPELAAQAKPEPIEATRLLRQALAAAPDGQVVIVQVGFSTNVARLLASAADDLSPLPGTRLVERKCRLLSIMAGNFQDVDQKEYNVITDEPAATKVFAEWPTDIVASGFEIGQAIRYPASSIERDFRYAPDHPIPVAYRHYAKMPYDRECWDLTSALVAVRADRGYFNLSEPGTIRVERGLTRFNPSPTGRHRYLKVSPDQAARVREALTWLVSQPPRPILTR